METRIYSFSDIEMFLASKVVVKNLIDNLVELATLRTTWNSRFAESLEEKINSLANDTLGKKSSTALFEATANLQTIIIPAQKDIRSLKIQIDTDFKKDEIKYKIMLDELGFSAYYSKIHGRSQKAIIGLLNLYASNIGKYKTAMVEKGTPEDLIDRISGYGAVVTNANTIQEQLKTAGKSNTAENIVKLNDLYNEISGICKIAANYYQSNPEKKEMFTFKKIVSNLGSSKSAAAKAKAKKLKAGEAA